MKKAKSVSDELTENKKRTKTEIETKNKTKGERRTKTKELKENIPMPESSTPRLTVHVSRCYSK
jgi:hypothetical protein